MSLYKDRLLQNKVVSNYIGAISSRLFSINPVLKNRWVKSGTNIRFIENGHKFPKLIPGVG